MLSTYTQNGKTVTKLVTPAIRQQVRQHFSCASLDGAEIEDGGGSGTGGSHLEKRIFMNEFMTGTSSQFPVKSAMTLAVFEDSGWYRVDYAGAQTLPVVMWRVVDRADEVACQSIAVFALLSGGFPVRYPFCHSPPMHRQWERWHTLCGAAVNVGAGLGATVLVAALPVAVAAAGH